MPTDDDGTAHDIPNDQPGPDDNDLSPDQYVNHHHGAGFHHHVLDDHLDDDHLDDEHVDDEHLDDHDVDHVRRQRPRRRCRRKRCRRRLPPLR